MPTSPPARNYAPLRVLIVHGIGHEGPGFAQDLTAGATRAMQAALSRLGAPGDAAELLAEEALWDRYVADQQARLQHALRAQIPPLVLSGALAQVWHLVASHAILRVRARVVPFVGDILAYQRPDAKRLIAEELDAALARLAARAPVAAGRPPTEPGALAHAWPLTIIGHSLGTVIASDYLWDRGQRPGGFALRNFFTLGSPMAFYALRYGSGRVEEFDKPLAIPPPGCWVNCYHPADPVATPLRRLNPAYQAAVLHDAEIRNASLITAHTSYWKDAKVHEVIGEKLALDWAEANSVWTPEVAAACWRQYAERLRL